MGENEAQAAAAAAEAAKMADTTDAERQFFSKRDVSWKAGLTMEELDAKERAEDAAKAAADKAPNEEWVKQHMGEEWMDTPRQTSEEKQDEAQAAK